MKTAKLSIAILICVGFLFSHAYGAEVAKIGVINLQEVLENSSAGQKAREEVNAKGKGMEVELKKMSQELEEIKDRLERERWS